MGRIIGIDMGTTNSCMAVFENGKPVVIKNAEGEMTTPSVMASSQTCERLVGEAARRQAIANIEKTIFSIKRAIGTENIHIIDGKEYSPRQIYAMVLEKLKEDTEDYLQEKVVEVVLTVPVYFDSLQCLEVKEAAKLVGLDVKRIMSEPVAAALAYYFNSGCKEKETERIMIYDLGGGNFNVAIIEIGDGVVEVLAVNGDTGLGGDDFDDRIVQWMLDEFKKVEGLNLSGDKRAVQRLKEAAEQAKKELSYATVTNIHLPFIIMTAEGSRHFDRDLTRVKFEEMTSDLIERTADCVQMAMKDAGMTNEDLDKVLLVGGSTRIPAIQDKIRQLIGKEPNKSLNLEECVAIGASIQGGKMMGNPPASDFLVLNVVPWSVAIETKGGEANRVIERNTTIPTKHSQIFSTAEDNQTAVDISIVQGESRLAKDNKPLGHFRLDGIFPAKKGVPQIEVTFDIDDDNVLAVSAKNLDTGKKVEKTFPILQQGYGGLYISEGINKMLPGKIESESSLGWHLSGVATGSICD